MPARAVCGTGRRAGRRTGPHRAAGPRRRQRLPHREGAGLPRRAGRPFDALAAEALGTADTAALAGLDPVLAEKLGAAGRAPWQVLAGAAAGAGLAGKLLYDEAPYGVGYFVAAWS